MSTRKYLQMSGFTLIELLLVVAILGLLAAIAIPALGRAQLRARASRAEADTRQIVRQTMIYMDDTQQTPTALSDFVGQPGYMSEPFDPFGATPTTPYQYTPPSGLTGEIRAWSVGLSGVATPAWQAARTLGYSSVSGLYDNTGL